MSKIIYPKFIVKSGIFSDNDLAESEGFKGNKLILYTLTYAYSPNCFLHVFNLLTRRTWKGFKLAYPRY